MSGTLWVLLRRIFSITSLIVDSWIFSIKNELEANSGDVVNGDTMLLLRDIVVPLSVGPYTAMSVAIATVAMVMVNVPE